MCQFVESICCTDGKATLLPLHQQRVYRTFQKFFPHTKPILLEEVLPSIPKGAGKYKCRIVYDHQVRAIAFHPYTHPTVRSLQAITHDTLDYAYKYENRDALTKLYQQRGSADDIIIVQQGQITDSYFANLVFFDGATWFTPQAPLLKGVRRQHLLQQGIIKPAAILASDIAEFQSVCLINAMLDLGEVQVLL